MNLSRLIIALVFLLGLAACRTNPINPERAYQNKQNEAIVLVEFDSPQIIDRIMTNTGEVFSSDPNLSEASITHNEIYKGIIAIPAKVGQNFSITSIAFPGRIYTGITGTFINESRYTFKSPVLKIEQSGIYFYGSYVMTRDGVMFSDQTNEDKLGRAKNKFYKNFGHLKTLNFTWPTASTYSNYQISPLAQSALKNYKATKVQSINFSSGGGHDKICRLVKQIDQIDGLPVDKYVETALRYELRASGNLTSSEGKSIQGLIKKFSFSTVSRASITLGVEIKIADQPSFYVEATHEYEGSFVGDKACRLVTENIPAATQLFIEELFKSEKFKTAFNS